MSSLKFIVRLFPRSLAGPALAALAVLGPLPAADAASSQRLTVTTNADSGAGSLRAAVAAANADTNDTITFAPGVASPITLTGGELVITGSVTITGPGAGVLTVSGNSAGRVFHVQAGAVGISGLTVANGSVAGNGGGILVEGPAALTLSACAVSGNTASLSAPPSSAQGSGGGIYNGGTLTVVGSSFTGNQAIGGLSGGGIDNSGSLSVSGTTFTNNSANSGSGGGLYDGGYSATLTGVTFSGNTGAFGGAVYVFNNFIQISLGTFSSNTATSELGGALYLSPGASASVDMSDVSGNAALAGGGIFVDAAANNSGFLVLTNSALSSNQASGAGSSGGGGLYLVANGTASLQNDTISGNTASSGNGGGAQSLGSLSLVSVTIAANQAPGGSGGGLEVEAGGTASLQGTLVATNAAGANPDASGAFTTQGSNLIGDGTGATGFTGPHDQVGTAATPIDPLLGPLQNNGGPTPTQAIASASPALNADFSASPPNQDQRGVLRPVGPRADIGAFEAPSPPGAPSGLTATAGFERITLTYTGTTGATGYNIYRGLMPFGEDFAHPVNGQTPVRGTRFTDLGLTDGTTYFYVVKAVNSVGESAASNEAGGTPLDTRVRGSALAWGDNTAGELGTGDFIRSLNPKAVAAPPGQGRPLTNIVQVAAGAGFSLALTADGYVLAWGDDSYGQLGDGNSNGQGGVSRRDTPAAVMTETYDPATGTFRFQPLAGIVAIAAGREFSLALGADGAVYAWGRDQFGQLGNGTADSSGNYSYPYAYPVTNGGTGGAFTGAVAIAAGGYHSLAVMNDGSVMAWGSNSAGQLGNGASGAGATSVYPTPVSTLANIVSVAAGEYHSLALDAGGNVTAWGYDADGELGDGGFYGSAGSPTPSPVTLPNRRPLLAAQIAAGQYHSLALRADGSVFTWGSDSNGQLGTGASASTRPASALSGAAGISAGAAFSQALTTTHTLLDFGANASGQLGDGATSDTDLPVTALSPAGAAQPYLYGAAGGTLHALAIQNLPPTAARLSYTVGQFGRTVSAPGLLAGASDLEGDGPISVIPISGRATAHGVVTVTADGGFTYTPSGGYQGADAFTYQVSDGLGVSAPATVTLNVTTLTLKSLAVTPATASVPETGTFQFTATGTYNDGSTVGVTGQAAWTSSDTTVATVAQGLATASASHPGTVTITAAYGGFSAGATLTVTRTLQTLTVTPAAPSLAKGLTLPFTATAGYTDGATADVTSQVTWTTSVGSVATVSNAAGSQGVATAVNPGTAAIIATDPATQIAGRTTLTVTAAALVSIAVTPANATLARGGTQAYAATGAYTDGSQADLTGSVTWTTANPNVAFVDAAGNATAQGVGQTQIIATEPAAGGSPAVSGQTGLTVTDPNTVPRNHILYNLSGGQASLWDLDTAGNVTEHLYGPYTDAPASPNSLWAATSVASAPDGTTRLLWNNADARVMLWTVNSSGSFTVIGGYGPYTDDSQPNAAQNIWHALAVSVGPDNITHILWANTDRRMMFWNVDAQGNLISLMGYGPYTDVSQPNPAGNLWNATALATGPDGTSRIVWNNTDGRVMVWSVDSQGGLISVTGYGPYTDSSQPNAAQNIWHATAVSVGTDGDTHLLWNNTDGRVMFWNLDGQNNMLGLAGYGPYTNFSAKACSTDPQNVSHILWGSTDGTVSLWDVQASFNYNYHLYSPGMGYQPTALSSGP